VLILPRRPAIGENGIEDLIVIPVVVPERELVQVGLQVLRRDTVIGANDCPLEQRPERLNALSMDVAIHERFGMANGLVGQLGISGGLDVGFEFVGAEQFSFVADEGVEERGEGSGLEIWDDSGDYISTSLLEPDDSLLAGSTTATLPAGFLPTDVGVVHFDDTGELVFESMPRLHGLADLHCHSPGGFVGDSKGSFELLGADAFLGVGDQPDGCEPLLKRCSGTMEDGTGGDGELVSAPGTLPQLSILDPVGMVSPASWTGDAVGPAHLAKEDLALVLSGEPFLEVQDVHASSFQKECSTNGDLSQGDKA